MGASKSLPIELVSTAWSKKGAGYPPQLCADGPKREAHLLRG